MKFSDDDLTRFLRVDGPAEPDPTDDPGTDTNDEPILVEFGSAIFGS